MDISERIRAISKWNGYLVKYDGRTVDYIDLLGSVYFVCELVGGSNGFVEEYLIDTEPSSRRWGLYSTILTPCRLGMIHRRIDKFLEASGYPVKWNKSSLFSLLDLAKLVERMWTELVKADAPRR